MKNFDLAVMNSSGIYPTKYFDILRNSLYKFKTSANPINIDSICPTIIINEIDGNRLSNSSFYERQQQGFIEIEGIVFDTASGTKNIEYKMNEGNEYNDIPVNNTGNWNISSSVSSGMNKLIIKATDKSDNAEYYTLNIQVK